MSGEDEVLADVLSLCEAWLLESMGIARALNEIRSRVADEEIRRWTGRGLRSLRGVHGLLEYNLRHMNYKQGGRDRMLPNFEKQKALALTEAEGNET